MVDSGPIAMVATHIPAWQRLGLKLKNQSLQSAPIDPTSPTDTPLAGNAFRKRKVDSDDDTVITSFDSAKRFRHNAGSMSDSPASSRAGSESHSFSDSRRKSVTFSADTKAEDGSSSKRLVQAAYAARLAQTEEGNGSSSSTGKQRIGSTSKTTDKKQLHSSKLTQVENGTSSATKDARQTSMLSSAGDEAANHAGSSIDAAVPATTDGKQSAQQKSPKKPSNQPSSKVQAAQQKKKQDRAIHYLEEYATARQSWKFSKRHQIAILDMVLDVDQLPIIHDEALRSYLEGLQGGGTRQRLRAHVKEVIAAKGDVADDTSHDSVLQRAKLVLEALGSEDRDLVNVDTASKASPQPKEAPVSVQTAPTEVRSTVLDRNAGDTQSNHETSANQAANSTGRKRRRRPRLRKKRDASSGSDSSSSSGTDSNSEDS